MVDQNLQSQDIVASAREEVECRWAIARLPDIKEEIPVLPAATGSMDNPEPSSSRTQSLDAEHLLSHAEQFSKINSSSYPSGLPRPEPTSRWLKRLRRSTSDSFGLGTKCSNLGEASSHEKVNKFSSKIMKSSKNGSSEQLLGKFHGKEEMAADRSKILSQNGESLSADLLKKDNDKLLSNPWIRRWCHNRAATQQKKPEAVVACEPKSTMMEFGKVQFKQFPSIAAMALMGKTMNGFQQCEFQRKGSSVVWNTKGS